MEPNEELSGRQGSSGRNKSVGEVGSNGGEDLEEQEAGGSRGSKNLLTPVERWSVGEIGGNGGEDLEERETGGSRGLQNLLTPVERKPGEVHDGCVVYGYNLDGVLVMNSGVQSNVAEQFDFGSVRFDSDDLAEQMEMEDVEKFLDCGGYESSSSNEW